MPKNIILYNNNFKKNKNVPYIFKSLNKINI